MMPNTNRHKAETSILSNSGFTLIELLVAMAISSIVLTGLVSVYTNLSRSYATETSRVTAQQDIRSAINLLAQDIRIAGLDPLGTAGGGFTVTDTDDIEFIADRDYDGAITSGNMEQIRYYLDGTELIQRMDDDADTDEVLLDNVSALSFVYDDTTTPTTVVIDMTVEEPAGRTGTVTRTLTKRVKIRNQ
jgi:type IV pilus assembly protein PilW